MEVSKTYVGMDMTCLLCLIHESEKSCKKSSISVDYTVSRYSFITMYRGGGGSSGGCVEKERVKLIVLQENAGARPRRPLKFIDEYYTQLSSTSRRRFTQLHIPNDILNHHKECKPSIPTSHLLYIILNYI